jgi:hypothetical protein
MRGHRLGSVAVVLAFACGLACGGDDTGTTIDSGADAFATDGAFDGALDAPAHDAGDAAANDATSDGMSDAAADSSPTDAGSDASRVTSVRCGNTTCADAGAPPTGNFCCVPGQGQPPSCASALGQCQSGTPYYCNDRSDCALGEDCCESSVRALFSCTPAGSCTTGLQLCKDSSECLNGMPCVMTTCSGQPIGTCGPIDGGGTRLVCN